MGSHRAAARTSQTAVRPTTADPSRPGRRAARGGRRRTAIALKLVGVVAVAAAGLGAVGVDSAQHSHSGIDLAAGSPHSPASDAIMAQRTQAPTRDFDRQALASSKGRLATAVQQHDAALASLSRSAHQRAHEIAQNQWVLPAHGFHLTAGFGQTSGLWSSFHTGLDFAAPEGTPIYAIASGTIISTASDGAYGNLTKERLTDGTVIYYAHQLQFNVQPGDNVTQGQTIGEIGATGNVTGPHVHIEVRPHGGKPVDPYPQFVAHGVKP